MKLLQELEEKYFWTVSVICVTVFLSITTICDCYKYTHMIRKSYGENVETYPIQYVDNTTSAINKG